MRWDQSLLEVIKGKKEEITECSYRLLDTRNRRSIIIDCRDCDRSSRLNDEVCRNNVFNILIKQPAAERIILSHLYERDYEGKNLEKLYALAHFQDILNSYRDMEPPKDMVEGPHERCLEAVDEVVSGLVDTVQNDPVKAYSVLMNAERQQDMELSDRICSDCNRKFDAVIKEMKRGAIKLGNYFTHDPAERFDHDKNIRSHVRPSFSTSRIYTQPPENTRFMECYDIHSDGRRKLEVSIYEMTDRPEKLYFITPMEYNLELSELGRIERVRKKLIDHKPDDLSFVDPSISREYFRRIAKEMLTKDFRAHGKDLSKHVIDVYSDLLAKYTTGLGILEDILADERVTDVYINAPADTNPVHVVVDGEECVTNIFQSQDDLDSMVSRFRTISGRPFGEATPVLEMELKDQGVRVSVIGDPLSSKGLAYAFRKHASTPWTLPKLINTGALSPLCAGFLSFLMEGQSSILVAGDVGAGKTSLLCAMLAEIPQKYRILTIEDTEEIPLEQLQRLGWKIQGMRSRSSIIGTGAEISPDVALRAALRMGNSSLVLGEVRGPEVAVLYEAMQIGTAGNCVIGTIHGASTRAVYERIVHTLGVPTESFKSTDAVIVCANTKSGSGIKKKRKVVQVSEINSAFNGTSDTDQLFTDIFRFNASKGTLEATDMLDMGRSELIGKIAMKMGISIDEASTNIQLRARIKQRIASAGLIDPAVVEANAVSRANNMFWMLMDSQDRNGADYEWVYSRWCEWFEETLQKGSGIKLR